MRYKRKFSRIERYAIWATHGQRCWFCTQPLQFEHVTVDHFIPEWLLQDDEKRAQVLAEHGAPDNFNLDDFENWLPAHASCNRSKGKKPLKYTPISSRALEQLINKAPDARKLAADLAQDNEGQEIFSRLSSALERKKIGRESLKKIFERLFSEPANFQELGDILVLDDHVWVLQEDVEKEGLCACDRSACVDHDGKVYCYFPRSLSRWVINAGLYHKCYDEIIYCNRCEGVHKRGHIGKKGFCDMPFVDQLNQTDD